MQDVSGPGGETRCARPARAPGQAAQDPVTIAAMRPEHASAVLAIYQDGIDEGNATFETAAPSWPAFTAARLAGHRYVALGPLAQPGNAVTTLPSYQPQRHVADAAGVAPGREGDAGGMVLGWVAASAVSGRPAYAGVVEHSVYVHRGARGRGIARLLLDRLICSTEAAGIWTIQSGIFPENAASIRLHLAAGFRIVGRRERIGQQHGRWRDVVLLERRSPRP